MVSLRELSRYNYGAVEKSNVVQAIDRYIPSSELLNQFSRQTNPEDLRLREQMERIFPGTAYVLTYSPLAKSLLMVPPDHPLANTGNQLAHGLHYGSGVFEGGSAEPVRDGTGAISAANIILHHQRMARMANRSLPSRNFELPVTVEEFSAAIMHYLAVLGPEIYQSSAKTLSRAYIRPYAAPNVGSFGVSLKPDHEIIAGCVCFRWSFYFPLERVNEIYNGSGARVAVLPAQRLQKIDGKDASNYGPAGPWAGRARELGYDEAAILGPYLYDSSTQKVEDFVLSLHHISGDALRTAMLKTTLADGPGEEYLFVRSDGVLAFLPTNVNRLGGTTLQYIIDHLAPSIGLKSIEMPVTGEMIINGEIVGAAMVGNAVRVAPVGNITYLDGVGQILEQLDLSVPDILRKIVNQYEAEVSGQITPSHPSLLTPIDLKNGAEARQKLDRVFLS